MIILQKEKSEQKSDLQAYLMLESFKTEEERSAEPTAAVRTLTHTQFLSFKVYTQHF